MKVHIELARGHSLFDMIVAGQGREVEDGDVFSFNADFQAQLFRVKINSVQLKETVEENQKTNEQVLQDRQYQVSNHLQPERLT